MAIVNFYASAFDNKVQQIEVENGTPIKNIKELGKVDFENTIIFVNGQQTDCTTILKDNDICTVREFPAAATAITIVSAFLIYETINGVNMLFGGENFTPKIIDWTKEKVAGFIESLLPETKTQDQLDQIPSIQGGKNQSGANQPFPLILGESYYTPIYIGTPYVTIDTSDNNNGEDEYFTALYCLGQKDIEVRDFELGIYRITSNNGNVTSGTIPIDSNSIYPYSKYKTQLEIRNDNFEVSLYNQKVVQESLNAQLICVEGNPLIVRPFSARFTERVRLEVMFQSLIAYNDDGDKTTTSVEIGFAYSLDGGNTHSPLEQQGSWGNSSNVSISFVRNEVYESVNYCVYRFSAKIAKQLRFALDHSFDFSQAQTCIAQGNSVIEFCVRRFTNESEDTNRQDKCHFTRITSWCFDKKKSEDAGHFIAQVPLEDRYKNMLTRVGFKIKSTEDLSGTLDAFNCIVKAKGRTYNSNTETWSEDTIVTSNTASMLLMALQSNYRGKYAYSDSQLDLISLGELYRRCEEYDNYVNGRRYEVNGVINSQKKTSELANAILSTANAYLVMKGTKYGVFVDEPQENTVMVLNNQNVLEASNTKAFSDKTHSLKVKFINAVNYYKQDTMVCTPSKYDDIPYENRNIVDTEFLYYTNPKRVYRKAMRMIAEKELRPEVWNRKVGIEGNLIEIGNLIELQDDTISVGIGDGAEITQIITDASLNITQIVTDGNFNINVEDNYAIKITQADGIHTPTVRTYEVIENTQGTYNTFTLKNVISADSIYKPCIGDIVTFGIYQKETVKALCFGKKDNGDGTFNLTLVPYNEDIYNSENGEIPEFISNVTPPTQNGVEVDDTSQYATIEDMYTKVLNPVISGDNASPSETPNITSAVAYEDRVNLRAFINGKGLNNTIDSYVWYCKKNDESEIVEIGTSPTNTYDYYFDRTTDGYLESEELAEWKFYVKAINIYSIHSEVSTYRNLDVSKYGTWQPIINTNSVILSGSGRNTNIKLSLFNSCYGTPKFKIKIKRLGESADTEFYKPNISADPYSSEDSYKVIDDTDPYITYSQFFSQTLPLQGQNDENPNPQSTVYQYCIVATNESGKESEEVLLIKTALPTSAKDIVDNAITTNKLSDGCITAEKLHADAISADLIATKGMVAEQAIIGKLTGEAREDYTNYWDLENGHFRLGNENQYLKVEPILDAQGQIANYEISLKAGNISLTSSGLDFQQGTFFYDDNDPNKRLHIGADGFEIQRYILNEVTHQYKWETVAKVNYDENGNFTITNDATSSPIPAIIVNNCRCYNFDKTDLSLDETSHNYKNISVEGTVVPNSTWITDNQLVDGKVEFTSNSTDELYVLGKDEVIYVDESFLSADETIERLNITSDSGLSQTVISNLEIDYVVSEE